MQPTEHAAGHVHHYLAGYRGRIKAVHHRRTSHTHPAVLQQETVVLHPQGPALDTQK